jgi:hypothetical protein
MRFARQGVFEVSHKEGQVCERKYSDAFECAALSQYLKILTPLRLSEISGTCRFFVRKPFDNPHPDKNLKIPTSSTHTQVPTRESVLKAMTVVRFSGSLRENIQFRYVSGF